MKTPLGTHINSHHALCANGAIHTSLGQRPRNRMKAVLRAESPAQLRSHSEHETGFQPLYVVGSESWDVAPGWYGCGPLALRARLAVRILVLCFFASFLNATFAAEPAATAAKEDKPPCCKVPLAPGKPTDKSLYRLDSKWTSDVGKTVPLSVLRGRPQVVAMFFTNCEYACPIIVNDLRRLETLLPAEARAKTEFLLVSFDTKRDTPEVLAAFRKKEKLPVANWTLLRGGADDVRELAALLGINYAPDARGQFAHSTIITVLNAEGEVAFQQPGLNAAPDALISAVAKAAAAAQR